MAEQVPLSTLPIRCGFCGLEGQVAWKEPATLSPGFHLEEKRIPGRTHVIVCDACDEILLD